MATSRVGSRHGLLKKGGKAVSQPAASTACYISARGLVPSRLQRTTSWPCIVSTARLCLSVHLRDLLGRRVMS